MRVVIAEDLGLLREGLVRLLESRGVEVVAAVEDGPALRRELDTQRPDLAVVDVRLPPTLTDEGLRVALAARQETPELPILVLSQYVEPIYARELLANGRGAVGYLLKDRVADFDQFLEACHRVASGGVALDPQVVGRLISRRERDPGVATLTAREHEVLSLMAQGRSNAAIARALVITEKAVGKHTTNIFDKLGLHSGEDDNRRVLAVLAHLQAPP
jgi:DNA-binding NarL/FixJ family response regulator